MPVLSTPVGSVEVSVDGFGVEVPPPLVALHTAVLEPLAVIKRGSNFHGLLQEWFYAAANSSSDAGLWVLWLGDNGSQNDDDVGRLVAVAYCDRHAGDEQWLEREDAAPILMRAYVEWMQSNYEDHYAPDDEVKGSPLIPTKLLASFFGWHEGDGDASE